MHAKAKPKLAARLRRVRRRVFKKWAQSLTKPLGLAVVSGAGRGAMISTIALVRPVTTNHPLIRIGSRHDGGYLVPDDLTGIAACFSPGVSTNVAFELDLAGRGIQSYMVDASIDALPAHNDAFTFDSLWLGATDDAGSKRISLDSWVSKYAPDPAAGDLLLQMDIEDAEWVTLAAVSRDTLARFRIIVLELHDLTSLASRKGNLYIKSIFKKLREDFDVVHAHPNNYFAPERVKGVSIHPILEITLLRRDRINSSRPTEEFPHPLDSRNLVRRPDVRLRPIWYRQ